MPNHPFPDFPEWYPESLFKISLERVHAGKTLRYGKIESETLIKYATDLLKGPSDLETQQSVRDIIRGLFECSEVTQLICSFKEYKQYVPDLVFVVQKALSLWIKEDLRSIENGTKPNRERKDYKDYNYLLDVVCTAPKMKAAALEAFKSNIANIFKDDFIVEYGNYPKIKAPHAPRILYAATIMKCLQAYFQDELGSLKPEWIKKTQDGLAAVEEQKPTSLRHACYPDEKSRAKALSAVMQPSSPKP